MIVNNRFKALYILTRPVKPISLYGLFFRETYKKVKECQPNSKFGDISREVSHRWEMLCSHEKAKYKKRIDEAKKEYKRDLEEYNKNYFEIFSNNTEQRGKLRYNHSFSLKIIQSYLPEGILRLSK